jgi:Mn2+/Fe2+ NRAMP family transporter
MTDSPDTETPSAPARTASAEAGPARKRWFAKLGLGLITGAADDDPSGSATYSQAGAQFGYGVGGRCC